MDAYSALDVSFLCSDVFAYCSLFVTKILSLCNGYCFPSSSSKVSVRVKANLCLQ